MIAVIDDLPEHVLGMSATGKVSAEDYLEVVFPTFSAYRKQHDELYYLLCLDTSVANFTLDAWLNDAILGYQYFTRWRKVAIVSPQTAVVRFTNTVGKILPGEYRGFRRDNLAEAVRWISVK